MKTNKGSQINLKAVIKKIGTLFLFAILLVFNEACQHKKSEVALVQDAVRAKHSNELLTDKLQQVNTKYFDGDIQFTNYIAKYLQKKNKKINTQTFVPTLIKLSHEKSYDPIFLLAVMKTESSYNFNAVGSAGEIGLMQIKPDTAKWVCEKNNIFWKGAKALKNPEYNILIGAHYFQYLKNTLKSKSLKYVNAYNLGLTSMHRMPSAELKKHPYLGKVLENYIAIYTELKKIKKSMI